MKNLAPSNPKSEMKHQHKISLSLILWTPLLHFSISGPLCHYFGDLNPIGINLFDNFLQIWYHLKVAIPILLFKVGSIFLIRWEKNEVNFNNNVRLNFPELMFVFTLQLIIWDIPTDKG